MLDKSIDNIETLDYIKNCFRALRILWTYHITLRMKERNTGRKLILSSIDSFEIIEDYPKDKYLPSCLIRAEYEDIVIHISVAVDFKNRYLTPITIYKPTLKKWYPGFRIRRK